MVITANSNKKVDTLKHSLMYYDKYRVTANWCQHETEELERK